MVFGVYVCILTALAPASFAAFIVSLALFIDPLWLAEISAIMYGDDYVSVGAVQDLKQANDLARKMIGNFGMGTKLKVFYNNEIDNGTPFLGRSLSSGSSNSENTKYEFDREVLELINEAYKLAVAKLRKHQDILNKVVEDLLEKEVLIGTEILDYLNEKRNNIPEEIVE